MAKLSVKGIRKPELDRIVNGLASPIKQHMKRCKQIGDYLLYRMLNDDKFVKVEFNKANLSKAIYYHDIGKSRVAQDYLQLKYCKTKESKYLYYTHVNKGIDIIKELLPEDITKYKADSFELYLYQCVSEHHERVDGTGYPGRLNEDEISLAGKVCGVIDLFDNLVFVGNAGEISFKQGLEKFKKEIGISVDYNIANLLIEETEILQRYVEKIASVEKKRIKAEPYGMFMVYQPVVNLKNRFEIKIQARMRINDPYFGLIKPGLFIPIAEQTTQINELFYLSLGKVCQTIIKLDEKKIKFTRISVFLNAKQLLLPKFVQSVFKVFDNYEVSPERVGFVITLREELETSEFLNNVMSQLKQRGIRLTLDEFGEQYASFDLLTKLPFEGVIISSNFTKNLERNTKNIEIVRGMIQTVKNLNVDVITQEINNSEEEEIVKSFGCYNVQGEKYALPMKENQLITYCRRQRAFGSKHE